MSPNLTSSQVTDLAKPFVDTLETFAKYFENPEVEKGFKEWHLKKFGCEPKEVSV